MSFISTVEEIFRNSFQQGHFVFASLLAFCAGFLTSLSPCVYPIVPITLSILGSRKYESRLHGFVVACVYVAGMISLYVTLGIAFSSFGLMFGAVFQNPIILLVVSLLFFALAFSMFGAFDFSLPQGLLTKLSRIGADGMPGVFAMGLVAGLIAAPCTGPVLAFILTLIAVHQDFAHGTLFMMFFGLGMGLPFLVLGTFSSLIAHIPKSGPWMNIFKNTLGLAMLLGAVFYLQLAFPWLRSQLSYLASLSIAWGILLVLLGIYFGVAQLSLRSRSGVRKLRKILGVCACALGFGVLINWASLPTMPESTATKSSLIWRTISHGDEDAVTKLQEILRLAKEANRPVLIDWYADWCEACKELDQKVYSSTDLAQDLRRFELVKVDVTRDSIAMRALQQRFNVLSLPTVTFMTSMGEEDLSHRINGFLQPEVFQIVLQKIQ